MSRLRHRTRTRYAALHNQFGTAGLVLSVVAIVLALGGGAYAANHATASKAKAGPRGKTGKTGPAGPAGTNGTNGTNGAAGTQGPQGKEGPEGKQGPEGNGGGFSSVLPPGQTEVGAFGFQSHQEGVREVLAIPFTFTIGERLPVQWLIPAEWNGGTKPTGCSGTYQEPTADPGHFCVYELQGTGGQPGGSMNVDGTFVTFSWTTTSAEQAFQGDWALTAPE